MAEDDKKKVRARGWGIFKRCPVEISLAPAPVDSGIVINGKRLNWQEVRVTKSTLSFNGILMPEHFLSVCYGLGIDNLKVEIRGGEFPFFDGSGKKYLNLLRKAKIRNQEQVKEFLLVKKPLVEFHRDSFIAFLPGEGLEIRASFSYSPLSLFSSFSLSHLTPSLYEKEIVWAKTFGRYPSPSFLKRIGLSYQKKGKILIPKRLRTDEEFIRHKILDLLGDLRVIGRYLRGKIFTRNPSHRLNQRILRRMAELGYGN
ncbi:MAG: UDP-3-O-acyl-N-acetylglucosamine deacetylase [candidate division WOR-3 bacterium]